MIKPGGVVAAILAAVLGAVAWGFIAKLTGYEIGYVAWGIGAIVGFASSLLGSRGIANGVLCAVLAIGSIAAGKVMGSVWSVQSSLEESYVSREMYDEYMQDARLFAGITEDEHAVFMVERDYSEAATPEQVTPEELAQFRDVVVPDLVALNQQNPSYEEWKAFRQESASADSAAQAETITMQDHIDAIVGDLNAIDALFAFLGIATAFALGKGGDQEHTEGGGAGGVDYDTLRYTPPADATGPADAPGAEPRPSDEPKPPGDT